MDRNDGQEVGISASSVQRIWRPIVGTRKHLDQAVQFAAEGKVKAQIHKQTIFSDLSKGKVDGRMVLTLSRRK